MAAPAEAKYLRKKKEGVLGSVLGYVFCFGQSTRLGTLLIAVYLDRHRA